MDEYICMDCLNVMRPYKETEGRSIQCSQCKKRRTVKISTLRRAVERSKELPLPFGEFLILPRPLDFPGPILSLIDVLGEAGSSIREGFRDLSKIIAILREWKEKDKSFREAITTIRRRIS